MIRKIFQIKKLLILAPMSFLILLITLFLMSSVLDEDSDCSFNDQQSQADGGSSATGEWTKEGTQAYKNAKAEFSFFTGKGASGSAAAGAVGYSSVESGHTFDPTIVQGGGHSSNPKEIHGATGTNGYGIFQISPGEKFGNWKGFAGSVKNDESSVQNQSDYIWSAYNGASTTNGIKHHKALKNWAGEANPRNAMMDFFHMVGMASGSAPGQTGREEAAMKAYDMFGGADIPMDSALIDGADSAYNGANNDANNTDGCSVDSNGSYGIPIKGDYTLGWYATGGQYHTGIDFNGTGHKPTQVVASHDGKVIMKQTLSGSMTAGTYLYVDNGDGYYQYYGHLSNVPITIQIGSTIKKGQLLGVTTSVNGMHHTHIGFGKKGDSPNSLVNATSPSDLAKHLNPLHWIKVDKKAEKYTDEFFKKASGGSGVDNQGSPIKVYNLDGGDGFKNGDSKDE